LTSFSVSCGEDQTCECAESGRIAVGGEGADIAIPGDTSENRYAFIENRDGHPWVLPAAPTIEVLLNGAQVDAATPVRDGDELEVGRVRFMLAYSNGVLGLTSTAESPRAIEDDPVRPGNPRNSKPRPGRIRTFKAVLLTVFLVLVTILLFVFFATPVAVSILPAPDHMDIEGFPPPVPLQDRYLVLPGEYSVSADKPGYEPLRESVSVDRGKFTRFTFELKKLPGRITVHSRPDNADVSDGEDYLGPTPLLGKKLAAGPHRLVIARQRYQDAVMDIEVEGLDREQIFRVELAPDWAPVTFRSDPEGASVIVEGTITGVTPLTLDILSGDHQVLLELDQYQPETIRFTVEAAMAMAAPVVTLTPLPAELSLSTKPATTVTVDGVYRGSTPLDIELSPWEKHEITLAVAGYETATKIVDMEPGETGTLSLEMAPRFGVVFITASPADTVLSVDGRAMGQANQRIQLTARRHALEFSKPGYETKVINVTPRPGVSKELNVDLVPEARARPKAAATATAQLIRTGQGQELKLIDPGEFTMGSSRREQGHRANENLRRVVLSRPYYLGVREVTNLEFRRFRASHRSGTAYGRSLDLDNQPVVNIGWDDAVAYLNWLSGEDGLSPAYRKEGDRWLLILPPTRGYRLPTEAEWARTARFTGSEPKKYAWGATYPPGSTAENFADRSASGDLPYTLSAYDDSHPVSAPVGSYSANEAGLHDIGGNVAEWVHDHYAVYPTETNTAATDPRGPESGRHHVVRGAGWKDSTLSELRLSYRDYADEPRDDLGFRIARNAD
jgi:formylglycine-generating enzyme required for sulfatase activity